MLLFAPLGVALAALGRRLRETALAGLALSTAVELVQLAIPGRTTSTVDVLCNTLGAALGWWGVAVWRVRRVTAAPLPTLVLVTGAPGTGKTTLADALGRAIPCPVVGRDELKEGMAHAAAGEEVPNEHVLPVFFDVVRVLVRGGVSLVAEAAFQDALWRVGVEELTTVATVRIVRCTTDPGTAAARIRRRQAEQPRWLRIHGDAEPVPPDVFGHLTLDAPSLTVDTTQGCEPSLERILAFVATGREP